jgi:hypothetical protein
MFFYYKPQQNSFPEEPERIDSLAQIRGLEGLSTVCRRFDIEITAIGSMVRRLAFLTHKSSVEELPDLFELIPFISDIDLIHDGSISRKAEIEHAIVSAVPWSECFRWQIFPRKEYEEYDEDQRNLPVIPLNKLALSTRSSLGIQDPFGAIEDVETKKIRLLGNPGYSDSLLRFEGRDSGILHALYFLEVACEHGRQEPPWKHPGWSNCIELISEAKKGLQTMPVSRYLRARLRYRTHSLRSACADDEIWMKMMTMSGLYDSIVEVERRGGGGDGAVWLQNLNKPRPRIVSNHLSNGRYRASYGNAMDPPQIRDETAQEAWDLMTSHHRPLSIFSESSIPNLDNCQRLLDCSPPFEFLEGVSPSMGLGEFVHLEFEALSDRARSGSLNEAALGILVALSAKSESSGRNGSPWTYVTTLPSTIAITSRISGNHLIPMYQIRSNFGGLLETFPKLIRAFLPRASYMYFCKVFIVEDHE